MTAEEKARERLLKFQQAKAKAEEEKSSHASFQKEDYPTFETCVLNKETPKIIRLMGNSPLMREKPTDPIIVKRSMCVDDNGHWATVILSDDRNHPINVLFRTIIGKYKYDKDTKTRTYDNVGKPSFERFMRNGKPKEKCTAMERGMMPDTFYLFNCIDKTDDWCEKNKHTKMLCWDSQNKEVDGETRTYYTYGVKPSFYNEIFDIKCTELNRMYDQFDVVAMRLKEKKGDSYLTILTPEQKTGISNLGLDPNKVTMDYLTDEEDNYTMYELENIPFVSRPTSIAYFLRAFGKLIKSCDIDFGTNLYEEFVESAEREKIEWAKKNVETKENESENISMQIESEKKEDVETIKNIEMKESSDELPSEVEEPTVAPTAAKKVVKSAKTSFDVTSLYEKYPALKTMREEDKALIVGYNSENDEFIFKDGIELAECPECGRTIPDMWATCSCGVSFE